MSENINTGSIVVPEITLDKVRELRRAGYSKEAYKRFQAFRESIEEDKRKVLLDIKEKDKEYIRKERELKKAAGICTMPSCNRLAVKGRVQCERCLDYKRTIKRLPQKPMKKIKKGKVMKCEICKKNVAVDYANIIKGTRKRWMCRFCHIRLKEDRGLVR